MIVYHSNLESRDRGHQKRALTVIFILALAFALSACVRPESDGSDLTAAATGPGGGNTGGTGGGTTPPDDTVPPPVDPDPPIVPPPTSDVQAFELFLHPVLVDANNFCVGCHGVATIPAFAVADVQAAYNTVVSQQKVDLNNPMNSRLFLRPAVDRHNCAATAIAL